MAIDFIGCAVAQACKEIGIGHDAALRTWHVITGWERT
jgi:hypothetical protein